MPAALPWMIEELRKSVVTDPVRRDSRSTLDCPLGLRRAAAVEAIGWGQANFDEPFGALSAEDLVLLYAYWNQKRHLEELSEAFRQLFSSGFPDEPLVVVDLGCGPFTGGLALAGQLDADKRFDYIGVDHSKAMRALGERFATAMEHFADAPRIERHWASTMSEIHWQRPPTWRPTLVIVSFLLASHSLDPEVLVKELDELLARVGRGETTLIYTNSAREGPNRSFPAFRNALAHSGFRLLTDAMGTVETRHRTLELRYALFHRRQRRTLTLGDV